MIRGQHRTQVKSPRCPTPPVINDASTRIKPVVFHNGEVVTADGAVVAEKSFHGHDYRIQTVYRSDGSHLIPHHDLEWRQPDSRFWSDDLSFREETGRRLPETIRHWAESFNVRLRED